ncbi:MAG: bifunctional transaldolase/phosoglucose isomerase [Vicinamibacteraceae bacterium]
MTDTATGVNAHTWQAPAALADRVAAAARTWDDAGGTRRLWDKDASLWTSTDEAKWLGWLDAVEAGRRLLPSLRDIAAGVRRDGFTHALLLGMGGSSLCPEVLARTFGRQPGAPELHVLDSTVPSQVAALESRVDLDHTLVIVASKSGSTLEPSAFQQYVFARIAAVRGPAEAARRFVAITDPGSKLEGQAKGAGYRHIVSGEPTIGGRYSALSPFGLVPAAVMGLDVAGFLDHTARMVDAIRATPAATNPGVSLGLLLGTAAVEGRDKLSLIASPGIEGLGAWLEQLVAESTGKNGQAIVPVDLEALAPADRYGDDRLFVYLRLATAPDAAQDAGVAALEAAGAAVVRIDVAQPLAIGQEFFRWEIVTAVASHVMRLNPFDQPDVEASKIETKALTTAYERDGNLPAETPAVSGGGLEIFADPKTAERLAGAATTGTPEGWLRAHLASLRAGDYAALLAFVEMNARHAGVLQRIRHSIRDRAQVATCVGFGPRFLHSTGQAYKGGSDKGVFLQITADDAIDLAVPGQKYTFGVIKAAQARGDLAVLVERGRRVLRVHLGADVAAGLETLARLVDEAPLTPAT